MITATQFAVIWSAVSSHRFDTSRSDGVTVRSHAVRRYAVRSYYRLLTHWLPNILHFPSEFGSITPTASGRRTA
jgi:hypothetical protein